jgi:hypothetical protein
MGVVTYLLAAGVVLLFMIYLNVSAISKRMKEHFPTEAERDLQWAKSNPLAHYEAHKNDRKK